MLAVDPSPTMEAVLLPTPTPARSGRTSEEEGCHHSRQQRPALPAPRTVCVPVNRSRLSEAEVEVEVAAAEAGRGRATDTGAVGILTSASASASASAAASARVDACIRASYSAFSLRSSASSSSILPSSQHGLLQLFAFCSCDRKTRGLSGEEHIALGVLLQVLAKVCSTTSSWVALSLSALPSPSRPSFFSRALLLAALLARPSELLLGALFSPSLMSLALSLSVSE